MKRKTIMYFLLCNIIVYYSCIQYIVYILEKKAASHVLLFFKCLINSFGPFKCAEVFFSVENVNVFHFDN